MKLGTLKKIGAWQTTLLAGAIYLLTLLKASQSASDDWLFVPWLKQQFWWQCMLLIVFMAVLYPVGPLLKWRIGKKQRNPAIKAMLDSLHSMLARRDEEPYTYRITLFKAEKKKWLKIYARNSHRKIDSRTVFRINPDEQQDNEGIAGQCWYRNMSIVLTNLPDVSGQAPDEDVRKYSEATFYPIEKTKTLKPRSRCLAGTPVVVNGAVWGCLVLDSESPSAIKDGIFNKRHIQAFLTAISQALQGTNHELD